MLINLLFFFTSSFTHGGLKTDHPHVFLESSSRIKQTLSSRSIRKTVVYVSVYTQFRSRSTVLVPHVTTHNFSTADGTNEP